MTAKRTRRGGGVTSGRAGQRGPRPTRTGWTLPPPDKHDDLVAKLGQAIVEAARQPPHPTHSPEAEPVAPRELARQPRRSPAELARLSASIERERRIEAGQRARRLPYIATATTAVTGYSAWGGAELAQAAMGPAGHTGAVAATIGLCALGLGAARVAFRHGISDSWTRQWWTAAAAATGWISLASAIGPDSWAMTAALTAGASTVASPWLRAHAVPEVADTPTPAPIPVIEESHEEDFGEVIARRWSEYVSRKNGPAAGALLTDRRDLPNALQWTVQTTPGHVAFDQLLAQLPRIASGLRQGQSKVILEPVKDDESAAYLSVVTRDVLAEGVPYTGPDYLCDPALRGKDGRLPIGPYADGTGDALYVAVDEGGCRNGLATGAPGSGKSAFLESVTLGLKSSGRWWVLFGDGDPAGGSSPLLNRIADWAGAGPEQALTQLEALEEVLEVRSALKSTLTAGEDGTPEPITDPVRQLPLREMLPCPDYPGVCWVLDELHRLTNDSWLKERKFAERLEKLTRIGRKYGIVLLAGTQSLLIADYGGGDVGSKLRAFLSDRNCFVFRNPNRSEQHVVSGLKIAPSTLPPGGGYAYATGTGRVSMLRVRWAPDLSPYAGDLPTVELDNDGRAVMSRHRPADAGDPTVLYANAAERLRQLRTTFADQPNAGPHRPTSGPRNLDHTTAGPASNPTKHAGPDHSASGPDQHQPATDHPSETGPDHPILGKVRVPLALGAANVIALPDHSERTARTTKRTGPDRPAGMSGAQQTVYDALTSLGVKQLANNAQLVDLTGLSGPVVSKALTALAERDLVEKVRHGTWRSIPQKSLVTSGNDCEQTG